MVTDPIADSIVRIKNAGDSLKETAIFPFSKIKMEICNLLLKEGFVSNVAKKGKKARAIEVEIKYNGKHPRIAGVKRVSKPSRRVYKKADQIRSVKNGYGMLVLSTPKGLLTGEEAKKENVGGEVLFEIW